MSFLSFSFLVFFSLLLLLYYLLPSKTQNLLLLCANCVFYLWTGPAAAVWLLGAALLCFSCALAIQLNHHPKLWLAFGVLALFSTLFVFKYLDFAVQSLCALFGHAAPPPFALALPLGISFYSFALAGYLFDVFRHKCPAEPNFLRFAIFVSFFPSILSGPINRARDLLPQLRRPRHFDLLRFKTGLWRFLCGAAKKLVLSVPMAGLIDAAYAAPWNYSSGAWVVLVCLYSIYIYVDFSAYSDIALGTAKMLGLDLAENFRAPYLSRSAKEFWKKWHISLTSWFREYLYFPLGGSRLGKMRTSLNILIVFAVSGLWHGAGFTFLVWGLLNGLYQVIGEWSLPLRRRLRIALHIPENAWFTVAVQGLLTFALITVAWVFFRADSVAQALFILKRILLLPRDGPGLVMLPFPPLQSAVFFLALALTAVEDIFIAQGRSFPIQHSSFRFWTAAALLAAAMLLFGQYGPGFQSQDFVYFDF